MSDAIWAKATVDWFCAPDTWQTTTWAGVKALQCPLDLWSLQEELSSRRYQRVIETGTAHGGSALFLAHMLDLLGYDPGVRVISVDVRPPPAVVHPRITWVTGDAVAAGRLFEVAGPTLISLDSDHRQAHVAAELAVYSRLSTPGDLLLVQDTAMGHPCPHPEGDRATGPWEAVEQFLAAGAPFVQDHHRERLRLTAHPGGWLRRV